MVGSLPKYSVNRLFIQVTCVNTTSLYNPNNKFHSNALVFIHILNKGEFKNMGATETVAEWVVNTTYEDIPPDAIRVANES